MPDGHITVVGLGPAGPELISNVALEALRSRRVWLRTSRHPAAVLAPDAFTFDGIYDEEDSIDAVYDRIVETLVTEAAQSELVYAVPGSPLVAEATVDKLRADPRVTVGIVPALSFLDLAWTALEIDPLAAGPRLIDGRRFAIEAAGERGPLLVAQCDAPWVLSDIKLAYEDEPPAEVTVLQRLGLPDQSVTTIAWEDLDRVVRPDHLTSLWIPHVTAPVASELSRLDEVARRLRADCPWDRDQTHTTLSRYLIEESYELLEAIDAHAQASADGSADGAEAGPHDDAHLIEELGDVLFQVFAHSAIAAEEGRFNISDVAAGVSDKLIARHPHVYGDVVAETAEDVAATWEANKQKEKGRTSAMDGIPKHLPALLYALKTLKRAADAGIEFDNNELRPRLGSALMIIVDEARKMKVDPEDDLRAATNEFRERFMLAEHLAAAAGVDVAADKGAMIPFWQQAAR